MGFRAAKLKLVNSWGAQCTPCERLASQKPFFRTQIYTFSLPKAPKLPLSPLRQKESPMSYHAANNLRANIARQKAFSAPENASAGLPVGLSKGYTMQEVYNGYAYVVGNGLAWGIIGLVTYHWAKILLASSLF
jgi:hypothetical protein